ncbi:zinc-binding dehydrogenase [Nocardioides daphniae]|uniref:enoyl-[acyl-carrier-protein] reductase n=1 Tax=Nocardioides daphniae TaxID=402297 RepID=A0ABQ1Q508_9ACTN|nr:zinc-binding dehydrogenase [Nocardioides daphniae]GGD14289.1 oxidoreductase/dehydrogenase [Nocardioides daphniae]
MRALVQHKFGDPGQVLSVEEVPVPEPGPGEVRVRTLMAAVHNHDLLTAAGLYGIRPDLPARAGSEAVGVVDALGEGVTGVEVGQRVAASATGTWAEYFLAPAAGLIPVSDDLPDEAAAQLFAMPFSAVALLESLGLSEGDWIVQNAANGAVGRYVATLARARGINVLGLVRRAAAVEELAAVGIDRVVATDTDDWRAKVAEVTGGAPIRAGVDSVGGKGSKQVFSLLAPGGELVVFGAMDALTVELGVADVLFQGKTVRGFWLTKVMGTMSREARQAAFTEVMTRIADGTLKLTAEEVLPLDEIARAAEANARPGRRGKVLLRP